MVHFDRVPLRGQVRGDRDAAGWYVDVEAEQTANERGQYHRGREELLRHGSVERLVEATGEESRIAPERLVEPGTRDRLEREPSRRRVVVLVFGQRHEAGDEGPDGAVVVVQGIEERAGCAE